MRNARGAWRHCEALAAVEKRRVLVARRFSPLRPRAVAQCTLWIDRVTNEPFCAGKGEKKQYENTLRFVGDFATVRVF